MSQLLIIFIYFINSFNIDCSRLPNHFGDYREAESQIFSATWKNKDYIDCSASSWVQSGSFYTCDGDSGYFVMKTKLGRTYIHQNVPKYLWLEFKASESFGTFYNSQFKGNYQLDIR